MKPLRLCIIGQMLGRNPGFITTQGQITADLFRGSGCSVVCASSQINRVPRLADIVSTIIRNRHNVDLMIVEIYSGPSFIVADVASLLAKYLGLPVVGVLHGGDLPRLINTNPRWTRRVLRRFEHFVAPSRFLHAEVTKLGFSATVIPNVIDLPRYPFRQRRQIEPRLIWMRAFHEIYQPGLALEVLGKVKARYPSATLVMAGPDKGLALRTAKLAEQLGLCGAVTFLGFLDLDAKVRAFTDADIFLNTSRIDNMPVALLEACAFGLPVVSTNVGGIPDLLENGETGLLVPDSDADALSEAIFSLVRDPDRVSRISTNGRSLAEKASWDSVKCQWDSVFSEVCPRPKGKRGTSPLPGTGTEATQ